MLHSLIDQLLSALVDIFSAAGVNRHDLLTVVSSNGFMLMKVNN